MKTLIILAHPNLATSKVNNHELYQAYRDWNINVAQEQQLLEAHDHFILQFPFYWYSYPPLLKKWLDDVFSYGWAYGSAGDKLKEKKIGLAMSIGDKQENYHTQGSVTFTVEQLLSPFQASMQHVGAIALPHFAMFGASFQATEQQINQSAKDYINYIIEHQSEPDHK
jgi:putative NADPH-quinone reductase